MLGVSDEHDARVIASYMQAGQLHAQRGQDISGTVDKARIFGHGLFDCFLATPDNVGWWGPLFGCTFCGFHVSHRMSMAGSAKSVVKVQFIFSHISCQPSFIL